MSKSPRSFTSSSTFSCTCTSEPLPQFNIIRPNTIGFMEAADAAKDLTDAELREQVLARQRSNAWGRQGGFGGTMLHSAAFLRFLYKEWSRRGLDKADIGSPPSLNED